MRVSGTVWVTVTASSEWPRHTRCEVSGWVPPGSGLSAIVDLDSTDFVDDDTLRRIADAVRHAVRTTVVGGHAKPIQSVLSRLPAAVAEAHGMAQRPEAAA